MHRIATIRVSNLNEQIICGLCFGYLIDAATIVECLHSFCRSCLVQYLAESNTCPLCCQLIHKTKPLVNIRSDKTLQNLVYKLVPGLFQIEMERRRNFYRQHPEAVPDVSSPNAREERGDIFGDPWMTHNNETELISISLQYSALFPKTHPELPEANDRRYLLCPAYVTVAVLKKFIRCKFDLPSDFHMELYYSDECLDDSYTVMDIASLYSWRRTEPLQLFYFVFDSSPSAICFLQQNLLLSAAQNDSGAISDKKVVGRLRLKKKRKTEHSRPLKLVKKFRAWDLDKKKVFTCDATLSCSNELSSTSATDTCDETPQVKQFCGNGFLAASVRDAENSSDIKVRCFEGSEVKSPAGNGSPDNGSVEKDSTDCRSVDIGTRLEETAVNRTLALGGLFPLRLLRLSPKLKPHSTNLKSERISHAEHHGSAILSSSPPAAVRRPGTDASYKRSTDATGCCRSSSSSLRQTTACSASALYIKARSSTEPRSIWSVLPTPSFRIQDGKLTVRDAITAEGKASSQRVSYSGSCRPVNHSRSSFLIYKDPPPPVSPPPPPSSSRSSSPLHPPPYSSPTSTNVSTSTNQSMSTSLCTLAQMSTSAAKVGIVICRGRAMPLQDKHLHLAPTTTLPQQPPPPPPVLTHPNPSMPLSDSKRPTGVKRPLQLHAESENLTATKKRKLSDLSGQNRLTPTFPPSLQTSHRRALGALLHAPTEKQKGALAFRDSNAIASSCPSKKSTTVIDPMSSLLSPIQTQSSRRPLKPRIRMLNVKPVERMCSSYSISCADGSNAAVAVTNELLADDDRKGIRNTDHRLELTAIKSTEAVLRRHKLSCTFPL